MSHPDARSFINQEAAGNFLTDVLKLNPKKYSNILAKISRAEKQLIAGFEAPTFTSQADRDIHYKDEAKRWELRKQIVEELFTMPRLEDDDKIKLGEGGALPQSGVKQEKKAFVLIGLPASGKSSISNNICENYGAIIIDPDFAKRKLPEFHYFDYGATLVHEESDAIVNTFGANNPDSLLSLYERAFVSSYNMVIPRIGHNVNKLIGFAEVLRENGYEIHLILTSLLRHEATIRAVERLDSTGRYVPLGLIFDAYGNDPILNYYLLRTKHSSLFNSFTAISTKTRPHKCIDILGDTPCDWYECDKSLLF